MRPMQHMHANLAPRIKASIDRPPDVCRVVQVIEVEFRRGEGCCEADPVRRCRAWYTLDGDLLAVSDPERPDITLGQTLAGSGS